MIDQVQYNSVQGQVDTFLEPCLESFQKHPQVK